MSGVFYSSHTNSTCFTTCCRTAICDNEHACPACGEEVPYTPWERHNMAMIELYGGAAVTAMRDKWARRLEEGT